MPVTLQADIKINEEFRGKKIKSQLDLTKHTSKMFLVFFSFNTATGLEWVGQLFKKCINYIWPTAIFSNIYMFGYFLNVVVFIWESPQSQLDLSSKMYLGLPSEASQSRWIVCSKQHIQRKKIIVKFLLLLFFNWTSLWERVSLCKESLIWAGSLFNNVHLS